MAHTSPSTADPFDSATNLPPGEEPTGVVPSDDQHMSEASSQSPLWMVTSEPSLNEFVIKLRQLRVEVMADGSTVHEVHFSSEELEQVRSAFGRMIRNGEEALHQLSQLLSTTFLTSVRLQSVVIGEVKTTHERFTLTQTLSVDDLYSTLDIDLGTRQLRKVQFADSEGWSTADLVANVVDYQPTEPNPCGIHRMTTRIKAEEEIWNKVVDEIFDLDTLVNRDKKLRHLSPYVKDIFGIKIVVGEAEAIPSMHRALEQLTWDAETLQRHGIEHTADTAQLEFVEVKDYLATGQSKRSGWEAIKSVVRWGGKTFEIQIQPLDIFLNEREILTRESHVSFKAQRDHVRNRVAEQMPLFRFYRDLLHWLFRQPDGDPPHFEGIRVVMEQA